MANSASTIAANVARVRECIVRAAARRGRNPQEITVVAVAKTFPGQAIREAFAAGIRHFAENRVQEWDAKRAEVADLDATWHMVGHLQSNKARRAVELFQTVDSLDNPALAQKLNRVVGELSRPPLPVLIEVRLAPEESKSGVEERDLPGLVEAVLALPRLDLRGLMCLPPFFDHAEQARPYFRRLRELRDEMQRRLGCALPELSMGMSGDFEVAIEEGATQVRLGTAIFGPRR